MSLIIPQYIQRAHIQDNKLGFEWDDWNLEKSYAPTDESLQKILEGISNRATLAVTVASGEWIAHRFALLLDSAVPFQYLEAAWASVADWRYCRYFEPSDDEWRGPVRGPASLAVIFAVNTVVRVEEDDLPAAEAVCMNGLVEHVLSDPGPFREWRGRVLERLQGLYPFRDDDPFGDVVPKEALDPDFDFRQENTETLIETFLSRLDPSANPFLRTPQEMMQLRFRGRPYHFKITDERTFRNEY